MRIRRHPPIDRHHCERLLDDPTVPPVTGRDTLAAVLAAAAGPVRNQELRGEESAMAAFRTARCRPTPIPTAIRRRIRGRLTSGVITWLTVSTATAITGVALAAGTRDGTPPAPPDREAASGALPDTAPPETTMAAGPNPRTGTRPTPAGTVLSTGVPPLLLRLCDGYLDKRHGQRSRGAESDLPGALIEAAGGREQVDEFCRQLLRSVANSQPQRAADGSGRGTPVRSDPTDANGSG